jgi:hypothetical protein
MTEENKPKYLEDLARYQYADVAARLGSSEETAPFAKGALEKLVDSFGVDKEILEGLKAGTYASEEGINTAIGIYAGKYEKALGSMNVTEFYDTRSGILKSILGDEKANEAKAVFEKYKEQTVGSIKKKVSQAQMISKDKTGYFNDKQKEDAKKTIEKLGSIMTLISLLEQRNYEELRNGATKPTYKETFGELLKKA